MRALGDNQNSLGESHYARKVKAKKQMYGSGDSRTNCCAHRFRLAYWSQ